VIKEDESNPELRGLNYFAFNRLLKPDLKLGEDYKDRNTFL